MSGRVVALVLAASCVMVDAAAHAAGPEDAPPPCEPTAQARTDLTGQWLLSERGRGLANVTQRGTCVELVIVKDGEKIKHEATGTLSGFKLALRWRAGAAKDAGVVDLIANDNSMTVAGESSGYAWTGATFKRRRGYALLPALRSLVRAAAAAEKARDRRKQAGALLAFQLMIPASEKERPTSEDPEYAEIDGLWKASFKTLPPEQRVLAARENIAPAVAVLTRTAAERKRAHDDAGVAALLEASKLAQDPAKMERVAAMQSAMARVQDEVKKMKPPASFLHRAINPEEIARREEREKLAASCLEKLKAEDLKVAADVCPRSNAAAIAGMPSAQERATSTAVGGTESLGLKSYEAGGELTALEHVLTQLETLGSIVARAKGPRPRRTAARRLTEATLASLSTLVARSGTLNDFETARHALGVQTDASSLNQGLRTIPTSATDLARLGFQMLLSAYERAEGRATATALALKGEPGPAAAHALFLLALRTGRGNEVEAKVASWARPQRAADYATLRALRAQLAGWYFERGGGLVTASAAPKALADKIEALERTLSLSADARRVKETGSPEDPTDVRGASPEQLVDLVRKALGPGAALVAYQLYRPPADGSKPAATRYAAFVLRWDSPLVAVEDLGPAQPIDAAIDALERSLRSSTSTTVDADARALHDLVAAPLVPHLAKTTTLRIAPDGQLRRVPFAALKDAAGWWLARYEIAYVSSAFGVRPETAPELSNASVAVFADPAPVAKRYARAELQPEAYARLSAARVEAEKVVELFGGRAKSYVDTDATEEAFLSLDAPKIVHVAAHGTVLGAQPGAAAPVAVASADAPKRGAELIEPPGAAVQKTAPDTLPPEVGWLRAALVLHAPEAGATAGRAPTDGFATAYEVRTMDLHGTELVVLSACQTAVGTAAPWYGVSNLQQAFHVAGATHVVASLWRVDDVATQRLMGGFYAALTSNKPYAEALRGAMTAMATQTPEPGAADFRHPYFWAPFVLSTGGAGARGRPTTAR